MNLIVAFICVLFSLAVGEIVAIKTKALIPSVFVTAIIFLIGFWTVFPKDILEIAGFSSTIVTLSMLFLITHMGTLLSLKELIAQWKTVLISLVGILGICVGTLIIGNLFFSWNMLVIATPPLAGGVVASIIMSEAATQKEMFDFAVLAILMYVMQGFVGYPLTAFVLRKECGSLLKNFREGIIEVDFSDEKQNIEVKKAKFFPPLNTKYQTTYIILLKIAILSGIAVFIAEITNEIVSKYVICLFMGVIGSEIGFIEQKPLNLSNTFGFYMTGLMAFIFGGLSKATPEIIQSLIIPFLGIISLGITGMGICSIFIGKILGESKYMSFAIALNALYGFPVNYSLVLESTKSLGKTKEEEEYLNKCILPKMLVGGFVSVTIVSVIIAGIFVKLLK